MGNRIQAHEAVVAECTPARASKATRARIRKQAARFFAHALASLESSSAMNQTLEELCLHIMEASAQKLATEQALEAKDRAMHLFQNNQRHYEELLKKSESHRAQLRSLSRQLLSAQEDERRKISRELHDVIAQTLTGINIKLATLKQQSSGDRKTLVRSINSTQRLVEKSVSLVHQFACELRPSVIDILGLIPALESLTSQFSARTGIHSSVKSSATLTHLNVAQRTCLFRVAEEALRNAARHSGAHQVTLRLFKMKSWIVMTIHDNGKSFCPDTVKRNQSGRHLGMLGMSERMDMVKGTLHIESNPEAGTTVTAKIPAMPATSRIKKTTPSAL